MSAPPRHLVQPVPGVDVSSMWTMRGPRATSGYCSRLSWALLASQHHPGTESQAARIPSVQGHGSPALLPVGMHLERITRDCLGGSGIHMPPFNPVGSPHFCHQLLVPIRARHPLSENTGGTQRLSGDCTGTGPPLTPLTVPQVGGVYLLCK